MAEALQGRILLRRRGDHAGAAAAVDRAIARIERTENLFGRVQVTVGWALVHAQLGDAAALARVEQRLSEAVAAARRVGFGSLVIEARFVECELLAARKVAGRARACFTTVAADARTGGFALLARKASERAKQLK